MDRMHRRQTVPLVAALAISVAGGGALGLAAFAAGAQAPGAKPIGYTGAQVAAGKVAYQQNCASCHGSTLTNGQFGPPLRGPMFIGDWSGRPVGALFDYLSQKMPPSRAGTLSHTTYSRLLAFLLSENRVGRQGSVPLPTAAAQLMALRMPGRIREGGARGPGGGLTPGVKLPPWPAPPNPLDHYVRVSAAMLRHPPAQDWLTWRRDYEDSGYSPLAQIRRDNVRRLHLAWALALPAGPNEDTPLEYHGVLFVHAFGGHVMAINAATGAQLWEYTFSEPPAGIPGVVRNMALYGHRLYFGAANAHLIALDARTGKVDWNVQIANPKEYRISGGPLVAQGVVMQGTTGEAPGGNILFGFDARTGKQLWRTYDIAQPGDPNSRTWNGAPLKARTGGSLWTAGSYDPRLKLAYFGSDQTYGTAPLVNPRLGYSNAGLYTDTTLAINPANGHIVWYYQDLPDDQWDYDFAFERQIMTLPVAGIPTQVVFTMGKTAVADVVQAASGKYVFSLDLGLQNVITSINPETGAKTINPRRYPNGKPFIVCPHAGGAKNWMPGAYDPQTHMVYESLIKSCMEMTPVPTGQRAALSSGYRWTLRPWPGSHGRYGRVEAINLESRRTVWKVRERAPETTGVLATAGGLVFAGALDRYFTAYNAATGKALWRTKLSGIPSSAPITYSVHGRQYVAMVVGYGAAQAGTWPPLVPEIKVPAANSAIFVFELPRQRPAPSTPSRSLAAR